MTVRQRFVIVSIVLLLLLVISVMYWPPASWFLVPVLTLVALGIHDWKSAWNSADANRW